jgi:4'-phosphopantetheinyl transferase
MRLSQDSIQVWVVRLAEQEIEAWRPGLSESEWQRAMRFRMPADRRRFAVTRGVLRTLLGRYLQLPSTAIGFTENEYGKPAVAGELTFNVAHSGDYALLAFARGVDVGVDVEHMGGDRVVADLAQRILSPGEYERFVRVADSERTRAFFQIWTLKESFLKGIGSGLSVAPERVEVSFYPDEPKLLGCPAEQIQDVNEWTLRSLSIGDEDYAAAIAVRRKRPAIEVMHVTGADFGAG